MNRIYKTIRGKTVKFGEFEGTICGFGDGTCIAATEQKPLYSFRKLDKGTVIEIEEYKDSKYRYFYVNESDLPANKRKI